MRERDRYPVSPYESLVVFGWKQSSFTAAIPVTLAELAAKAELNIVHSPVNVGPAKASRLTVLKWRIPANFLADYSHVEFLLMLSDESHNDESLPHLSEYERQRFWDDCCVEINNI